MGKAAGGTRREEISRIHFWVHHVLDPQVDVKQTVGYTSSGKKCRLEIYVWTKRKMLKWNDMKDSGKMCLLEELLMVQG